MRFNLRNKFLIPTVLLLVIGLSIITVVASIMSRDALKENVTTQVVQQADSTAKFIMSWLDERKLALKSWSEQRMYQTAVQDSFVGKASRKPASLQLTKLKQEYQGYEDIHVANAAGEVVASSDSELPAQHSVSDRQYFQEALQGNLVVSDAMESKFSGHPVFIIANPISEEDTVTGVLFAVVDLTFFNEYFIGSIKLGEAGYAFMFSADGQILAHPDTTKVLSENLNDTEAGPKILETGAGVLIYTAEGKEKLGCFEPIEGMNWTIGLITLTSELFAPVNAIRNVIIVVALLVFVASVISILFLVNSIVTPIKELAKTADQLADGNVNCILQNFDSQDEIGILSRAFKNLTQYIQDMASAATAISQGDLSRNITPKSQQDVLGQAFFDMSSYLNDMSEAATALAIGDIQQDVQPKTEHDVLGNAFTQLIDSLQEKVRLTEKIAHGDLSVNVEVLSDQDVLGKSLNTMFETIQMIIDDLNTLTKAATEGQLDIRGDAEKFTGNWRALLAGINNVIEAFATPITTTADYIERISRGDIPEKITEAYQGDFNEIIVNLNLLIDATNEMSQVAGEMAEGNLLVEVNERSDNDKLMQALNSMISTLSDVVLHVQSATENVAVSSHEMQTSSERVSEGAAEQAAAAEEASSSMEEMAANIKQNADNALQTEKIAIQAAEQARQSGEAVMKTVEAMRQIAKKIVIIEDIADQTRMLSLNATIEAARAKEHGKAFSVVASEVRKLADVAKEAATEINELTGSSMLIAENSGEMLAELVPNIQKTANLVQEISAASNEQSSGSNQINRAIQQLDNVTQQNAMTSESLASTAEELSIQAGQLRTTMHFFRIGKSEEHAEDGDERSQPLHPKQNVQQPGENGLDGQNTPSLTVAAPLPNDRYRNGDARDEEFERY